MTTGRDFRKSSIICRSQMESMMDHVIAPLRVSLSQLSFLSVVMSL